MKEKQEGADEKIKDKQDEVDADMKHKAKQEEEVKDEEGIKEHQTPKEKDEHPSQEDDEKRNEEEPAKEVGGDKEEAEKEHDEENGQEEGDVEDVEDEAEGGEEDPNKTNPTAKEGEVTPEATEEKQNKESADKKEAVTPSSDRPTRERKMVERYSVPERRRSSAKKPLSIEKGRGTALKDIPNVAFKLSKRKSDDTLHILHTILFGKKGKVQSMKRNIGRFSGFIWTGNEEKQKSRVKEKLDKCVKEKLIDFCDVLNIQVTKATVRKEELTVKILEFLESPHVTTDVLLADKEQKVKRRRSVTGKNSSPGEASATPVKRQKHTPPSEEKQAPSSKGDDEEDDDKAESEDLNDDLQGDEALLHKEESDQDEDESEEKNDDPKEETPTQKSSRKNTSGSKSKEKTTHGKSSATAKSAKNTSRSKKQSTSSAKLGPGTEAGSGSVSKSKGPASRKRKAEQQDVSTKEIITKKLAGKSTRKVSTKDQGKGKSSKKAKTEPTREELHAVVVDILKEVDFNTATLSDILRKLGKHFDVELMHRKAEVKDVITEVINNMSDEEEEEEEEEEAGGDAEKDNDGDDD
ncbi:DEK domain-containing chromatin-associated protein 1 [Linum perenne]